jgi:hypothetical protein
MSKDSYISSHHYYSALNPDINGIDTPEGFVDKEISWRRLSTARDGTGLTDVKGFREQIDDSSYMSQDTQESIRGLREYYYTKMPDHTLGSLPSLGDEKQVDLDQFRRSNTFAVYIREIRKENYSTRRRRSKKCWSLSCGCLAFDWWKSGSCYHYIFKHDGQLVFRIIGGMGGHAANQDPVFDWEYTGYMGTGSISTTPRGTVQTQQGSVSVSASLGYAEVTIARLVGYRDGSVGIGRLTVTCRTTQEKIYMDVGIPYVQGKLTGFAARANGNKGVYTSNTTYTLGSDTPSTSVVPSGSNQFWIEPALTKFSGVGQGAMTRSDLVELEGTSFIDGTPDSTLTQDCEVAQLIEANVNVFPNTNNTTAQFQYRPYVCTAGVWSRDASGAWTDFGSSIVLSWSALETQAKLATGRERLTLSPVPTYIETRCKLTNAAGTSYIESLTSPPDDEYIIKVTAQSTYPAPTAGNQLLTVSFGWATNPSSTNITYNLRKLYTTGSVVAEFGYILDSAIAGGTDNFLIQEGLKGLEEGYPAGAPLTSTSLSSNFVLLDSQLFVAQTVNSADFVLDAKDSNGVTYNNVVVDLSGFGRIISNTITLTSPQKAAIAGQSAVFICRTRRRDDCEFAHIGYLPSPSTYVDLTDSYTTYPEIDLTAGYAAGATTLTLLTTPESSMINDYIVGLGGAIPIGTKVSSINAVAKTITLDTPLSTAVAASATGSEIVMGTITPETKSYSVYAVPS